MLKNSLVADDGSLNLEMALIIVLLVLIATASLALLGGAIATKYDVATSSVTGL